MHLTVRMIQWDLRSMSLMPIDSENERESNRCSIMMDFENVDMHTALTEDEEPFSG